MPSGPRPRLAGRLTGVGNAWSWWRPPAWDCLRQERGGQWKKTQMGQSTLGEGVTHGEKG